MEKLPEPHPGYNSWKLSLFPPPVAVSLARRVIVMISTWLFGAWHSLPYWRDLDELPQVSSSRRAAYCSPQPMPGKSCKSYRCVPWFLKKAPILPLFRVRCTPRVSFCAFTEPCFPFCFTFSCFLDLFGKSEINTLKSWALCSDTETALAQCGSWVTGGLAGINHSSPWLQEQAVKR